MKTLSELKYVINKIINEELKSKAIKKHDQWGNERQEIIYYNDDKEDNKFPVITPPPKDSDFEYGNFLFADPNVIDRTANDVAMKQTSFKKNEYDKYLPIAIPREANTHDEDEAIKQIQTYFNRKLGTFTVDDKFISALIKLKHHYPKLLDPSVETDILYRGNKFRLNDIENIKLDKGNLLDTKSQNRSQLPHYRLRVNNLVINEPRDVRKILSFSSNIDIPLQFALNVFDLPDVIKEKYLPVLITAAASNTNFILNPKFSNIISNYFEYESLYYGNSYVSSDVYLIDPFDIVCKAIKSHNIKNMENFEKIIPEYFDLYTKIMHAETNQSLLLKYQKRLQMEMKK